MLCQCIGAPLAHDVTRPPWYNCDGQLGQRPGEARSLQLVRLHGGGRSLASRSHLERVCELCQPGVVGPGSARAPAAAMSFGQVASLFW